MLAHLPAARIIDVTHEVPVYWPAEAGFWLARAYSYFPTGSVHVAVVDPGVGTVARHHRRDRGGARVPRAGQRIARAGRARGARSPSVFRLDTPQAIAKFKLPVPSATFHGRDIFAPIAAELAAGRSAPADLGPRTADIVPSWVEEPAVTADQVSGVIITIDHFGNLITNIDAELIRSFAGARRAHRRPQPAAAADLRRRPARGISRPGEFLRGHRDRPGRAERRGGARGSDEAPRSPSPAAEPPAAEPARAGHSLQNSGFRTQSKAEQGLEPADWPGH